MPTQIGVTNPSHKRICQQYFLKLTPIGVTNPSYKRICQLKSGLQTPPTREYANSNRGYKPLLQEKLTPIKSGLQTPPTREVDTYQIGVTNPSHKRICQLKSGLQTPPTREYANSNRGYKPLLQENMPTIFS